MRVQRRSPDRGRWFCRGVGACLLVALTRIVPAPAGASNSATRPNAGSKATRPPAEKPGGKLRWFRGNTHAHTRLSGHGDADAEVAAQWYHDQGYHFAVLSEHNAFLEPRAVLARLRKRLEQADPRPRRVRRDFLLLGGQEVTQPGPFGARVVHVTALGTRRLVDWTTPEMQPHARIRAYVDRVRAAGGVAILNHPNLSWSLGTEDILPVRDLRFFELYNGHPHAANAGGSAHPSTEAIWDTLLSKGMRLYGLATDDAHLFLSSGVGQPNPGRAWIMVRARRLTREALLSAMKRGDFYASSGVFLRHLEVSRGRYSLSVDLRRSAGAIRKGLFGEPTSEKREVVRIEFFGRNGRRLRIRTASSATHAMGATEPYVRARVTLVRRVPVSSGEKELRAFFAWTQPAFR